MDTKFTLRKITINDLDNLVLYANNKKIARFMTDKFPHPYTQVDGENFIKFCNNQNGSEIRAISIAGELVGAIGLHQQNDVHNQNAEMGYWLAEPFWNKGITTLAIKETISWGFSNLSVSRIFARPYGSNIASQRVLEKAGFIKEAHLLGTILKWGEVEDELIYGTRRK